jgi:hypothetical protein
VSTGARSARTSPLQSRVQVLLVVAVVGRGDDFRWRQIATVRDVEEVARLRVEQLLAALDGDRLSQDILGVAPQLVHHTRLYQGLDHCCLAGVSSRNT